MVSSYPGSHRELPWIPQDPFLLLTSASCLMHSLFWEYSGMLHSPSHSTASELGASPGRVPALGTVSSDSSTLPLSLCNKLLAVENTREGREHHFHVYVLPARDTGVTDAGYWNQYFSLYRLLTLGTISVSYIQMLYSYCDFSHIHKPNLEFCTDVVNFELFL